MKKASLVISILFIGLLIERFINSSNVELLILPLSLLYPTNLMANEHIENIFKLSKDNRETKESFRRPKKIKI